MAPRGATKHQFRVTASVEGEGSLGLFDTMTGGETDSTESRHHAGGMGPEEALGGPATVSTIVVSRNYRRDRDRNLRKRLRPKCGIADMTVRKQPLDANGHPFGDPEVFTGVLKRIQSPEPDSDSGDAAMIEIEMTPDETVA